MSNALVNNREQYYSLPINYDQSDYESFDNELKRAIPAAQIHKIENIWINEEGVIVKKFEVVDINLTDSNRYLEGSKYKIGFLLLKRKQFSVSPNLLLAFDCWTVNYFHFLLDFLPRLFFSAQSLTNPTVLVTEKFPSKYIDFLELIGVSKLKFIRSGHILISKKVYVPDLIFSPSGVFSKNEVVLFRAWILSRLKLELNSMPAECIYISRRMANSRRIVNEEDVIEVVRKFGFKIYFLEELTVYEQVVLFQKARIVLSIHGAALANLLFMQQGASVVEVRLKTRNANNTYFRLANVLGLPYYYIHGESDNDDFQNSDIFLNISELENLLRSF